MNQRKQVQIHNNPTLFPRKVYSGLSSQKIDVQNGARIVFTLYVYSIDVGASVNVKIKDSFSQHMPMAIIEEWNTNSTGHTKRVLSDFHNLIDVDIEVTGGNAELIFGISVYDNAVQTRVDIANAEISVDLNHEIQPNGKYDSVRIGDGTNELEINDDGSINVNFTPPSSELKMIYNSVLAVPKDITTLLGSYLSTLGKKCFLQKIFLSGNNFAEYSIKLNGNVFLKKRTWAGSSLNIEIPIATESNNGLEIKNTDTLTADVIHSRPFSGDFEITFQVLEI